MHSFARLEHVASFLIGLAAAFGLSRVTTWWLNSGFGVGTTMAVLCVLGCLTAGWGIERRRERLIALWLGHLVAMTVQLFVVGPGTIWPLVLVVGGFMTAAAVLAGAAVAWLWTG